VTRSKPKKRRRTRKPELPRKPKAGWLATLDRRHHFAKTLFARRAQLVADLGGDDALSYAEKTLAERAIYLEQVIRDMEARHAQGKADFDHHKYIGSINALANLLGKLGMKRAAKRVPSLPEYLEGEYTDAAQS
jgi:hypothetical protein